MTAGILDPSPAMTGAQLTSTEEELAARIDGQGRDAHSVAKVAIVLGAAFLLYQAYMKRRLKEEMKDQDPSNLAIVASAVYQGMVPRWVQMVAPALVSGYLQGMAETAAGDVPTEYLMDIAESYAYNLGVHLNDVSIEAALQGYNAQVNRRIVARRAVENVIGAFGVPLRTMNSLVTVWTGEQKKVLSRSKPTTKYDAKLSSMIDKAVRNRGKTLGETEAWTAKSQAKQLAWMWGIQHGTIPETATRVWITANDERVCPVCGPLHKMEVPVGQAFQTDIGDYWSPPLHPNCRCDITLAIDILAEFKPIREEELAKALGKDPYDRDRRGRFARKEQRAPKVEEQKVRLTPIRLPGIQIPDEPITQEPEGKVSLGWGKVSLGTGSLAPVSLGQGKVSLGGDEEQLGFERRGFTRRKLASFHLPTPEQIRVSLGKEKGRPPAGFHTLPTPLWGFVGTQEETQGQVLMDVDEDSPFYEPDRIENELNTYWTDELQDEHEAHYNGDMDTSAYFLTDARGKRYVISTDDYLDVLEWVIDGKPDVGKRNLELMAQSAYAEDDYPEGDPNDTTVVSYQTLADHLGAESWVAWRTPTLMLTMYGTEFTGMNPRLKGALQNPGRWAITEARPDSIWGKDFERPVKIVYAEPPDEQDRYGNPGYTS